MSEIYIKFGWIPAKQFEKLTGITVIAVRDRTMNANFPEWRLGGGMVKLLRDGYYVNYERYQECMENQPANYRLA